MNRRNFIAGATSTVFLVATSRFASAQQPTPTIVEGSNDNPARVGETVAGDGLEMTLNGVEVLEALDDFTVAEFGKLYLLCDFTIRNVSDEKKSYNRLNFAAKDLDTGFTFDEESILIDNALRSGEISAGDLIRGYVAIKVNADSGNVRIKYDVENFFLGNDTEFFWLYNVQTGE